MQRRYPDVAPEPLADVYLDVGDEPAWVAIGMVASVDGAATVAGRSTGLGADGDRAAFRGLRASADAILVGAGTARAENYGSPHVRHAELRTRRGQADRPVLAIVSRSLDLLGLERFFGERGDGGGVPAPVVLTVLDAPPDRRTVLEQRGAEVVALGRGDVDLRAAIGWLRGRGLERVLCEGGPHLNGQLLAAGVVDELFVTVAPTVVGGDAGRIVVGAAEDPLPLALREVRSHGSELLLRYRVCAAGRR